MKAEGYLKNALGGNMNISTLKLKFWIEIMEEYASEQCKDMYPKQFVEWLYFGETNFYSIHSKHKWYNGFEDCYMTTVELYEYWKQNIDK